MAWTKVFSCNGSTPDSELIIERKETRFVFFTGPAVLLVPRKRWRLISVDGSDSQVLGLFSSREAVDAALEEVAKPCQR